MTDYKEKILEEANKVAFPNFELAFLVIKFSDLVQILAYLPSEKEITKRIIGEYVAEMLKDAKEGCPVGREFRAIFEGCINWLDQKEGEK